MLCRETVIENIKALIKELKIYLDQSSLTIYAKH